MAEGSIRAAAVQHAAVRASERFLSWPRAAAIAFFLVFAAIWDEGHVHDDGVVYYFFLRRALGSGDDYSAVAFQFGSAFWNAPFYLVSQLVAVRGQLDGYHAGEVAIAVAANAAVVVTLYLGWRILRELDLPRGPAVLLLALFGTPLWFYGSVWVSYKHVVDTLYMTAAFFFLLEATRENCRRLSYVAAGTCLGLLAVTRFANIAVWAAIFAVLIAYRLWRAASWTFVTATIATVVLLLVPVVRHI